MKRVASLGTATRPKRPQEPKRPFSYREEEVTVSVPSGYGPQRASAPVSLAGTLTLPPGKGPFPAVLFITGSGPEDRDETVFDHKPFLVISDALTRAGIATLRFDDRGTGKSGGAMKGLTTLDFAQDAIAELTFLAARPEIDVRALGIIGHSEGGTIAPIVASQGPLPRFLVLLAGTGVTGLELLRKQIPAGMRADGVGEGVIARSMKVNETLLAIVKRESDPSKIEAQLRQMLKDDPKGLAEVLPSLPAMSDPWLRAFLVLDPVPYLQKVKVPVLALNGERDVQVDPSNLQLIEKALKTGGNKHVTAVVMPGLNHLFQHAKTGAVSEYVAIEETIAPDVLAKIRDYILDAKK